MRRSKMLNLPGWVREQASPRPLSRLPSHSGQGHTQRQAIAIVMVNTFTVRRVRAHRPWPEGPRIL